MQPDSDGTVDEFIADIPASPEAVRTALEEAGGRRVQVVPASALPAPAGRALDEREIAMARQLVAAMGDPFDIAAYHDEYRERVAELMQARAAGKVVKFPRAQVRKTDVDLADVLQASLDAADGGKERKRA